MSDLYTEFNLKRDDLDSFEPSRFGYVIETDGTILSLRELQVHGNISYERSEEVQAYYDELDEDRKSHSMMSASIFSTEEHGSIRISIAPYIGSWSMDWSRTVPVSKEQLQVLDMIVDLVLDREEIVQTQVSLDEDYNTVRKRMKKLNWGVGVDE